MTKTPIRGWVYIISNKAMPNIIKVGFTLKDPALRAKELSTTGIPYKYEVEYEVMVESPYEVEQKTHSLLSEFREDKEWFRCSASKAKKAIKQITSGISILENTYNENHNDNQQSYNSKCQKCKTLFSATINPKDKYVTCPNCKHNNSASTFICNSFSGK